MAAPRNMQKFDYQTGQRFRQMAEAALKDKNGVNMEVWSVMSEFLNLTGNSDLIHEVEHRRGRFYLVNS